ncbi:MAG: hypothetical protein K0R28_828 [Paenibacillus sp.]|jgi:hypothetical protein|nr:hypothetical protein [Paenibacillus sp.]
MVNCKPAVSVLICICLLVGLMGSWSSPASATPTLHPEAGQDGGLILTDEMSDFSQAYAVHQVDVGNVTEATYVNFEDDASYLVSSGSDPYVVYKKKDMKSVHLVLYAAPSAALPELNFLRSSDGTTYHEMETEMLDEGSRDGSWRRIVYFDYNLASTDYLKVSWAGDQDIVLSKIRIGYTGGAASEEGKPDPRFQLYIGRKVHGSRA